MEQPINFEALAAIMDTLPLEVTFIDENNVVSYYSRGRQRMFLRTPEAIGRNVSKCHPESSLDAVNEVINSLKSGERDSAEFWINHEGRKLYMRYFAVRNKTGKCLGIIEVIEDITEIRKITGTKRLIQDSWSTRFE